MRMAFTSSATAVRANSNWSWGRAVGGKRVTGRLGLCSCLRGLLGVGVGEVTWERGSPPGGGIQAGCCWFPWGRVTARVGAGRDSHLRADKARPLVTDMLQGGSDVNFLYSWRGVGHRAAQGVSRGDPESLGHPGVGDLRIGQRMGDSLALHEVLWPRGWAVGTVGKALTFRHAVQYHVDEDVGTSPPCTIAETGDGERLSSGPSGKGVGTWRLGVGRTLVEPLGLA